MTNTSVPDRITVTGVVATEPRHLVTSEGQAVTSFRLASPLLSHSAADTNWYTITCFHRLAINAAASIQKGDRIIAAGTLHIRAWSRGEAGEVAGTTVEIEADTIGHDLAFGQTTYTTPELDEPEGTAA